MPLLIFRFCWLMAWAQLPCEPDVPSAIEQLKAGTAVTHIIWVPHYLESTDPFLEFLREKYPHVQLEVINLYCETALRKNPEKLL